MYDSDGRTDSMPNLKRKGCTIMPKHLQVFSDYI